MSLDRYFIKWGAYAGILLLAFVVQFNIIGFIPFPVAPPMVIPLCAVVLASFEGHIGCPIYGMFVGILCDCIFVGSVGQWTVGLAILAHLVSILSRYTFRQSLLGCLITSLFSLFLIETVRMLFFLLAGVTDLSPRVHVAIYELGWSLLMVIPLYFIYRWVFARVPKFTVL